MSYVKAHGASENAFLYSRNISLLPSLCKRECVRRANTGPSIIWVVGRTVRHSCTSPPASLVGRPGSRHDPSPAGRSSPSPRPSSLRVATMSSLDRKARTSPTARPGVRGGGQAQWWGAFKGCGWRRRRRRRTSGVRPPWRGEQMKKGFVKKHVT